MQYFAYVRQYSIFVQFTPEKRMQKNGSSRITQPKFDIIRLQYFADVLL